MDSRNITGLIDITSTLERLENDFWGNPPKDSSKLVIKSHELRKKKLEDFEPADFRLLIGQNIGLQFLIPIVIEKIRENPFIEADFYEGDLLLNILKSDKKYWTSHSNIKNEVINIFERHKLRLANELDITEEIKADIINAYSNFIKD
jgi:hypothetical protein